MNGKTSATSRTAAAILIFCNFVAMFVCITVFGFSLWLTASPTSFANAVKMFGNPTLKALLPEEALSPPLGVGLAVLAVFFFFVSFMGLYGAIVGSQFLLFMYATLVILLLLLECAVMYYVSSNLLEKGLQEPNSHTSHALRLSLQCCEHTNRTSAEGASPTTPWSCCGAEAFPTNCTLDKVYTTGCHQAIVTWLYRYETVIYVALASSHVLLSLCSLLRRALSASRSYT
ncbi:uncharacterized protein LOC112054581 [Bicyclus anynana]|uniref:Uncharacterized protein LOC112054581 n=1 Tax=Bicyclus anynana TaxID=110368 RepID=A0ABM3M3B8_BICAN|nr:uncharacterized protein LOC112054581 [Bicyclus anynana]XP_052745983.1 uncharacterized protein LOC112054581 [Bicyclus anynana]XP_052745984.1 uncharacterized protein LOC112054581 [Bicyclus anynana]XP_052745985.1 uncharacterized protein LOC112054581 [Bicyclus anynana]